MAAAASIVPPGLLHMRPLQHWLHGRASRWPWKHGTHRVQIQPMDRSLIRTGVPLERVSRHSVVFRDASATSWGATYDGHAVSGIWMAYQLPRVAVACSLSKATLGTDALAPGPAQICVSSSEPASTDTEQDQGGQGSGPVSGSISAEQDLVPGTHAPRDSPSLADSSEEGSAFSETGHHLAPASRLVETPCVVPGWDAEVLGDLPQEVALTIASARALSTRRAYALKWNLFIE